MAQQFINCTILEPFNPTAPDGFAPSVANADLIYVGAARGWVEDVYRVVGAGTGHVLTTANSYTQGDLLIKYRLGSSFVIPSTPPLASNLLFSVAIGGINGDGWQFNDQFYAATQEFKVAGFGGNRGSAYDVPIPAGAAVQAYRGPRYMRINWNTSGIVKAKVWQHDKDEPTAWQRTTTASGTPGDSISIAQMPTSAGDISLSWFSGYEYSFDLHWVAISDNPSEPAYKARVTTPDRTTYPGGFRTVAVRQILDDSNMPIANAKVRLYHQLTGAFLDELTTDAQGMVSFESVNTDGLCYAIATRATGGDVMDNFLNKDT